MTGIMIVTISIMNGVRDKHHNAHHQARRWERMQTIIGLIRISPANAYSVPNRFLQPDGQGRINPRNPNLYWVCEAEGHHRGWASAVSPELLP